MPKSSRSAIPLTLTLVLALTGLAAAQPPPTETGFIYVEPDVRLFYQRFGSGTPTVFIPNVSEMRVTFAPLLYLHDVVMWDPRGRGLSDRPDDLARYGMDVEIADAEKVREHFGADDITYVGGSLWGSVALLYAARHPESVGRVVSMGAFPPAKVLDTGEPDRVLERDVSALVAEKEAMEQDGRAEANPYAYCMLDRRIGWTSRLVNLHNLAVGEATNMCQYRNESLELILPVIFEGILGKWGDWDWRAEIASVRQPVMLVWGDHDWSLAGIKANADLLQNVGWLEMEGTDHAVWLDGRDTLLPMMDTFFRGEWPENLNR